MGDLSSVVWRGHNGLLCLLLGRSVNRLLKINKLDLMQINVSYFETWAGSIYRWNCINFEWGVCVIAGELKWAKVSLSFLNRLNQNKKLQRNRRVVYFIVYVIIFVGNGL